MQNTCNICKTCNIYAKHAIYMQNMQYICKTCNIYAKHAKRNMHAKNMQKKIYNIRRLVFSTSVTLINTEYCTLIIVKESSLY